MHLGSEQLNALWLHCGAVTVTLVIATALLTSARRLNLAAAGFWVLTAAALYFVVNPVVSIVSDELGVYALKLRLSGGTERIYWVTLVVCTGLVAFFATYARVARTSGDAKPETEPVRWTWIAWSTVFLSLTGAAYSIVKYRTLGSGVSDHTGIADGRFVGDVTGYEVTAHRLALIPVVVLLGDSNRFRQATGLVILLGYVVVRAFDAHDRASVVSILIAALLVELLRHRPQSPKGVTLRTTLGAATVIVLASFLMWRGHRSITEVDTTARHDSAAEILVESNTAMLPSLYMRTWIAEHRGYDYGLKPLGRAFFAALPRKYFPWKDRPVRWLIGSEQFHMAETFRQADYGSKSSVLGSFYTHGSIVGVLIGSVLAAFGAFFLDRLVHRTRYASAQALGIVWMSQVWIMFGSSDVWILAQMFMTGLPAIPFILIPTEGDLRRAESRRIPVLHEHLRKGRPPTRRTDPHG